MLWGTVYFLLFPDESFIIGRLKVPFLLVHLQSPEDLILGVSDGDRDGF